MTIRRIDLKAERVRIAQKLRECIYQNVLRAGYTTDPGGTPSPRLLSAMDLEPVKVDPADAALILEIFGALDRVHAQAVQADQAYLHAHGRLWAAEQAYRDPRVKGSGAKAVAAARTLGLTAKDPGYWAERYNDYVRLECYGRTEAIQMIADQEGRTFGAIYQGLKREISKRRSSGRAVPAALPRLT